MQRPCLAPLALLIVVIALAACGDDEGSGTETVTVEETTVTETATQAPTGEDGSVPPADREVNELTGFSSPTGNIGCFIEPASVRCDIGERDWEPPPPPADCELDYGQGIVLVAGATAELVCAGDTARGAGEELPYGSSIAAGLLRCESSRAGISCRDVETGRGFSISRESYELF